MSLVKPTVYDNGFQRRQSQGDLAGAAEVVSTLTTAGAGALTGAILATNILSRTGPGGAVADTTDTAANIITAIGNGQAGDTWRLRYINNVAFALTVTGVTGVTVTNGVVNASSVKDFLLTLTNATPSSVAVGTTTNASAAVTGMTAAQTALISPGQLVSGTGIAGGTTVLAVNPGVGVTLSANATTTGTLVALTFSPTVTVLGLGQMLL
jgi:hypothetical protein